MPTVYSTLECNLGGGFKRYLFTGHTNFSKIEAREVDENGNVISVDDGISVPVKEYKKIRKANRPHRGGTFITKGT